MKTTNAIAIIALSSLLWSCEKTIDTIQQTPTPSEVITVTQDEALAESIFENVNIQADQQHAETEITQNLKLSNVDSLPIVTVDGGENGFADTAWTVTIDYGSGMVDMKNWEHKGKIIVQVKGKYKNKGSYRIVTFDNYYVNDNKVEGTHTATNKGFDSTDMAYVFEVVVANAKITTPDATEITWESTRTRKWVAGYDTPLLPTDNVYEITGESHGVNTKGKAYTKTVVEPLVIKANCHFILDGILSVQVEDKKEVQIDYGYAEGTDECDQNAQVTINDKKIPFSIKR